MTVVWNLLYTYFKNFLIIRGSIKHVLIHFLRVLTEVLLCSMVRILEKYLKMTLTDFFFAEIDIN